MNDTATPLFTVVIPTYNHARYLGRALQSVVDQTYTNWEAIVIDNYSMDNTDEVIASIADPRITYMKIQNNGVIAASRNSGIREAKGEWIAFLDSDDWWTAEKLQACFDCFNDQVDIIYHDLKIISDQSRFLRSKKIKSWQVKPPVLIDLMARGNAIATSSAVVRKKLLHQLNGMSENANMFAAEDYNTWLRIAKLTDRFKYLPQSLGFYRLHNQGASKKDMSAPARHAASEFIYLLNEQQKTKLESLFRYAKGRFNYLAGNYTGAKEDLLFCLKHGRIEIKLKSILMLSFMALKS
jgi:glycosyltransferase involved in cell wall biosynthesis